MTIYFPADWNFTKRYEWLESRGFNTRFLIWGMGATSFACMI